ncbi:MAG: heavy metal translocating P-type ATPase [Anaerolineaceae bacterium]|nr:heavy metal translocating P-type ATPase [Anaerolineaceae bacterium]|tara:strand:- start:2123 stop:4384 length:2262 start_codon:yes stop_codon:yes gene_type:complete
MEITNRLDLVVDGMDCVDCAHVLQKSLQRLDGVEDCSVNFASGRMQVIGTVLFEDVSKCVSGLGYGVADNVRSESNNSSSLLSKIFSKPRNKATIVGIAFIILAFLSEIAVPRITPVLFGLGFLAGLYFPSRTGWAALLSGRGLDMNVLMTLAAAGAYVTGQYAEAATVIVLFNLGESLEGFVLERSRESIRALMELSPLTAKLLSVCHDCEAHAGRLLPDGSSYYKYGPCPWCDSDIRIVNVDSLVIGDVIIVSEGERIPMDGVVTSGESSVNQAPITGESKLVYKSEEDHVYAGTVNGGGVLEVLVTSLAEDNTLSRMIHLVEEAKDQKPPIQRFLDKFATIYTPVVVGVALMIAVVPPLFFGAPFFNNSEGHGWLYRALTMLVIACPCALLISTPVTIISAITSAAKQGVLIKGGAFLEILGRVRVLAFDKTGTLTHGTPKLVSMTCVRSDCVSSTTEDLAYSCTYCKEMVSMAAAVEKSSNHPLAHAIVKHATDIGFANKLAREVKTLTGQGVQGLVNGRQIVVGSHDYFDNEVQHDIEFCKQVSVSEKSGCSVILVGENGHTMGYMAFMDPLRIDVPEALNSLDDSIMTVMLTGDNLSTANAIAESAAVSVVHANMLPADKLSIVGELGKKYGVVAMVGDGVNDAPALAVADVGIAMGGIGTAQALETADVALMRDQISMIPAIIRHSQWTLRTIRFNVALSLILKAAFMVIAIFGVATLWMAVLADVGATLFVTLNGMRMLTGRFLR